MDFWDHHMDITRYYDLLAGEVCEKHKVTRMEYNIIMFLYNNPQHNTAADIVKVRKSTKSHVSTSLKELEQRGMVKRVQSLNNKRHVEIALLDKARPVVMDGCQVQKRFEKGVLSGLSQEEKDACVSLFLKICNNAEELLKMNKEEKV